MTTFVTVFTKVELADPTFEGQPGQPFSFYWHTTLDEVEKLIGLVLELSARRDGVTAYAFTPEFFGAVARKTHRVMLLDSRYDDDGCGDDRCEAEAEADTKAFETEIYDITEGRVVPLEEEDLGHHLIRVEGDCIRLHAVYRKDVARDIRSYPIPLDELRGFRAQLEELEHDARNA